MSVVCSKFLTFQEADMLGGKKRIPSDQAVQKQNIKERIPVLCDKSHQNYCAPKITKQRQEGEIITEKTVGN